MMQAWSDFLDSSLQKFTIELMFFCMSFFLPISRRCPKRLKRISADKYHRGKIFFNIDIEKESNKT